MGKVLNGYLSKEDIRTANQGMKRCPPLTSSGNTMTTTTTAQCQDTPVRMAKIQDADTTECWRGCNTAQPLWRMVRWFPTKLNMLLAYNPAITPLVIYPLELGIGVHMKTCTRALIAALSTIAHTWKQPRCPPGGERMRRMHFQTMEYHSSLRINKLLRHGGNLDARD